MDTNNHGAAFGCNQNISRKGAKTQRRKFATEGTEKEK